MIGAEILVPFDDRAAGLLHVDAGLMDEDLVAEQLFGRGYQAGMAGERQQTPAVGRALPFFFRPLVLRAGDML